MDVDDLHLTLRLGERECDLRAAQRLRYQVFVEELGGNGDLVDHDHRLERDAFDPACEHLLLVDERRNESALDHVVGVYRLLTDENAGRHGRFYSEAEYDLGVLKSSGKRLLELGRSCVHPDYRDGMALRLLWSGLADFVQRRRIDILFGVASLHGTNVQSHAQPLSMLHHGHLAPPDLRVKAVETAYQSMDLVPPEKIDRVAAMRAVPALIKSYLKLGGFVGDGAYVDHPFNTTDVCLVIDTARLSNAARARYASGDAS